MITLYRHALSGHSHRVELLLSLLGLDYELRDVDLMAGEHKTEAFLRKNPFGQVPVLEDGDVLLADSNAILVYLAKTYGDGDWYPEDPRIAAEVQRWLSVAAGEIANGPGAARLVKVFGAGLDHERAVSIAHNLLGVLETYLAGTAFLAGPAPTIADVAAYAYIAHAGEGDVDLAPYPAVGSWLDRIRALPGFVPMVETPLSDAA